MPSRAALASPDLSVGIDTMSDMGGAPVDVELPMDGLPEDPSVVTEMDDGSVEIDPVPHEAERPTPEFTDNLAVFMDESDLDTIATRVLDGYDADKESRAEWTSMLVQGMELLGLKFETRSFPFNGASGEFDPIMLEAVLRNTATTTGELLPAQGPAKSQIVGIPNELSEQKATRTKDWTNYYLYEGAPEWAPDMEQMFFWRAIAGSTFKKVYQCPIQNRPVAPFITPDKIVFNYHTDGELATCPRISHDIDYVFKDIKQRQLTGFYRDIELMPPELDDSPDPIRQSSDSITGTKPSMAMDNDDLPDMDFQVIEQHVDYDLKGYEHKGDDGMPTGLPLPYIISVEKTSRKVLAIRRNWRENDDTYLRLDYFVHYRLFAGLGSMGIGYAHILGNSAKAATGLLRQMKDAETLNMFPAGLRVKGLRMDDNNKMLGPCEWIEIDTGGLPINQAISPMPYKGASEVSLALWEKSRENAKQMASMADLSVGDGRQDAPVGTTLALLEAANRLMSATVKSAHRSLKKELKLFAALFGQYLPDEPYPFPVPGGQQAIMKADFSDEIDVIPVSDPNITSYAQRVTRAEALMRMAQTAPPGLYDLRAVNRNMLVEMGVDERKIETMLPKEDSGTPMEPLAENQLALKGKPIMVGAYQDHQAHIQAHQVLLEQVPNIAAHISEHLGALMRVNVEKELGMPLPPVGQKLPPEIENKVALMVAQALQKLKSPDGPEPTPGQIAMAEIQTEAAKNEVARYKAEQDAATKAFDTQTRFITAEKDRQERLANAEADRQARMRTEVIASATQRAIAKSRNIGQGRTKFGSGE